MEKLCDKYDIVVTLDPKPEDGDWNQNGASSEYTEAQGYPSNYNFMAQDWYANNIVDPDDGNPNPGFGTLAYTGRMASPTIYHHNPTQNYDDPWAASREAKATRNLDEFQY